MLHYSEVLQSVFLNANSCISPVYFLQNMRKSSIIKLTQTKESRNGARQYEVTNEQREVLKAYLGNSPKRTERSQSDNRKMRSGVLWVLHIGAPCRDLPEYYGPQQTVYKRFAQQQKDDKLSCCSKKAVKTRICRICVSTELISKQHQRNIGAKMAPGHDDHQSIGVSRGGGSNKIHTVVDGLSYALVLELDKCMMESCCKSALIRLIFPAVPFLLTKLMVNGKTVNTSLTMTLISAFRRSRIQVIRDTLIFLSTKKGFLLHAFS